MPIKPQPTKEELFWYHWQRTLKGLQDSFDGSSDPKRRYQLGISIDRLLVTYLDYQRAKQGPSL